MSETQIIYGEDGLPAFAVIPYELFTRLQLPDEEASLTDEEAWDRATADRGPAVPDSVLSRLLDGDNPVRVYREWRGLTQEELARNVNLTSGYISQLERGRRPLSRRARMAIAETLAIPYDDLES